MFKLHNNHILNSGIPFDGDGTPAGGVVHDFHRLFDDSDGNHTVDASDFAAFGAQFGMNLLNTPFDFDDNGSLDASDFAAYGGRFGTTL